MNTKVFREYFPYIKSGKIYFGHASTAPLSTLVTDKLKDYLVLRSETRIDDFNQFLKMYTSAKESIARMINTNVKRVAFLDNTTNGINILANGIQWGKGDRILLNDVEFPANVYPFLNLERFGVEVDFVKSNNGIVIADQIIESVKPGTKLISVSQVQFLSGYRIDLDILGKYCRENDILFCVDAIQGVGAVQIDVQKQNIDFLACGTQKWLLGLHGLSFIYLSEEIQNKIVPAQIGWLSVNDAWNMLDYNLSLKPDADRFEFSTLNHIGIYALEASMELFRQAGMDEIERRVVENSVYFNQKLNEAGYKPILLEQREEYLSGIVSIKHEKAQLIFETLLKNNIVTSVREGMVRFSPHFYNNFDDIDAVTAVLIKHKDLFR